MKATVKKYLEKASADGMSYSKAKVALEVLEHAKDAKEAESLLKEFGYKKGAKRNIIDSMYQYLLDNPKATEAEFSAWIAENGSPNTVRWEKQHQKARELVNALAEKLGK
jgi:hypothetical protein